MMKTKISLAIALVALFATAFSCGSKPAAAEAQTEDTTKVANDTAKAANDTIK